jgi:hypothetical protein
MTIRQMMSFCELHSITYSCADNEFWVYTPPTEVLNDYWERITSFEYLRVYPNRH